MAFTDRPQDNVRPFPNMGAAGGGRAVEDPETCLEGDLDAELQEECMTAQTIIKLMRFITQGKEHVADRAWLMDELKQPIATINSTLENAVVVKSHDRDPARRFACSIDLDGTVRYCLSAIDDIIKVIDNTIEEDCHNNLRVGLVDCLSEQFCRVDDILEHSALRPQPLQPTAH